MKKTVFVFLLSVVCIDCYPFFQLSEMCERFKKQSVDCFNYPTVDFLNRIQRPLHWVLLPTYFELVERKIRRIRIDFGPIYNQNFEISIDPQTFTLMPNLEELTLIKITNMFELPDLDPAVRLGRLTVHKSNLRRIKPDFCDSKPHLAELDLAYNEIEALPNVLDNCKSLSVLDLSNNRIKDLTGFFTTDSILARIQLDRNQIRELKTDHLKHLVSVFELSISRNCVSQIEETSFDYMTNLTRLDLSANKLSNLPMNSKIYSNLVYLNVNWNKNLIYFPTADLFKRIKELRVFFAYHCCPFIGKELTLSNKLDLENIDHENVYDGEEIQETIYAKPIPSTEITDREYWPREEKPPPTTVKCHPLPDAFMPCENLLETIWLRLSVWLISLAGISANTSAIVYNLVYSWMYYRSTNELNVPTYLLMNLAFADSLMAIYLAFIAVKDLISRDKFGQSALEWQRSRGCNIAGFLGVVSALASAFCLAFITFERYYAIKNSTDSNKRIGTRSAILISTIGWALAVFLAALPLTQLNLNSYESYALCLPFDTRLLGDRIYLGILNSILSLIFLFILSCYLLIFTTTLLIERRASQPIGRDGEDSRLARNITLLVVVNLICWAPVVALSARMLLFSSSHPIIDRTQLKLLAVFVLPFNSLANPFLYCIGRRQFRMDLSNSAWICRFKRNLPNGSSTRSVKSNATFQTKNGSF